MLQLNGQMAFRALSVITAKAGMCPVSFCSVLRKRKVHFSGVFGTSLSRKVTTSTSRASFAEYGSIVTVLVVMLKPFVAVKLTNVRELSAGTGASI